jgi:hypothetical protein
MLELFETIVYTRIIDLNIFETVASTSKSIQMVLFFKNGEGAVGPDPPPWFHVGFRTQSSWL